MSKAAVLYIKGRRVAYQRPPCCISKVAMLHIKGGHVADTLSLCFSKEMRMLLNMYRGAAEKITAYYFWLITYSFSVAKHIPYAFFNTWSISQIFVQSQL